MIVDFTRRGDTPKLVLDREEIDYRHCFINQGWKSMGEKRGYACRHDDKGVYVRPYFHDHASEDNQTLVPWDDVKTITCRESKLYDFIIMLMEKGGD
jgi:hypothetical protein